MGIFGLFGKKEDQPQTPAGTENPSGAKAQAGAGSQAEVQAQSDAADTKDLFMRSQQAHIAKDLAAATDYARQAAQSGGEKEVSWYKTLLLENFTRANREGDKAEMLRFAEEGERYQDGTLMLQLAALTMPETMEDIEKKLSYCDRAEALGMDVSRERELTMMRKQDMELDAKFASMPMPEDITKTIQQAQQIAMEMAKAEQKNPD